MLRFRNNLMLSDDEYNQITRDHNIHLTFLRNRLIVKIDYPSLGELDRVSSLICNHLIDQATDLFHVATHQEHRNNGLVVVACLAPEDLVGLKMKFHRTHTIDWDMPF